MKKNEITQQGLDILKKRYEEIINVEKPRVQEDLNLARSQGDLSENADYDAALKKLQELVTEENTLTYQIENSVVVSAPTDNTTAKLGGAKITALNMSNNKTYTFSIVGSAESDSIHGKISNTSPVALAVIGKAAGDIVTVNAKVPYQLKILKIGE